ncbi:alpha glucosidase [Hesseltinella vesiculosa]|uniref:Probable alpha/beta-glucosidase agdC n=1 Tax=Hesseltinella vesiculosa TaxID=101127 RepID=A0A1X2GPS0_9FUNG|nr:alpha glucosidase [Hesseltinella vesiculosa]
MVQLKISVVFAASLLLGLATADYPNFDTTQGAHGYQVSGSVRNTRTGLSFPLSFISKGNGGVDYFGKTIQDLTVTVDYETDERLHVLISDTGHKQYPVPNSVLGLERPVIKHRAKNPNYEFKYTASPFGFQVLRKSDSQILFDTNNQPFVFEDQYIELTSSLPDDANVYGLGETTEPFRKNSIKNVTTIFAADNATPMYRNVYGAHPVYMEQRNGSTHGVFLLSAHGMDVFTVNGRITYKIIGGNLEFYFFAPKVATPNNFVTLYTDLVGKPFMPSHWMLGWHQCRYGYSNISVVDDVVKRYKQANIPLEVAWIDIDYMDRHKDFTLDPVNFPLPQVKALSSQLHANGQKFVTMVDPALSTNTTYGPHDRLVASGAYVKNPDGTEYQGQVWPGYTAFPDWWHPNVGAYWTKEMSDWLALLDIDGIWIDMNEPSAFCVGSCGTNRTNESPALPWTLPQSVQDELTANETVALLAQNKYLNDTRNLLSPNYAIYNSNGNLSAHAVATTAQFYGDVPLYDIKNLYGHAMSYHTRNAIQSHYPKQRPFVLTRSTFAGTGNRAGHWTGDNFSQWDYLKVSIATIFSMNLFGISYTGADVCGFNGDATEELCTRWSQLGAFYTFARNHNAIGQVDQYPYLWETTAEASRVALGARYAMLPYYYTLHEESARVGTGVWRPLFFEYPQEPSFLSNDVQFLLGTDILISPVVDEGARSVDAQFPVGTWYDWFTSERVESKDASNKVTLPANLTQIPIHVRGGAVVPLKSSKYTVADTYATPYNLLIVLDDTNAAAGRLYVDDGDSLVQQSTSSIDFSFNNGKLQASGKFGYSAAEPIGSIKIVGGNSSYAGQLSKMTINGKTFQATHPTSNVAVFTNLSIGLAHPFSATF